MNKITVDQIDAAIESEEDVVELLRFINESLLDTWLQGAGKKGYEKRNELLGMAEDLTNAVEDYFKEF